jgi:hypothetical protein
MESEYYKLIDFLIFEIIIPEKGFDVAKIILTNEIPMEKSKKLDYLKKMTEYYDCSIRETSIMYGTIAKEQLEQAKVKQQFNERSAQIKSIPRDGEDEDTNPLLQSTFMGNSVNSISNRRSKYFGL